MATSDNNAHLPEELLAQIQTAAEAEGKSAEEWLAEAVRARLEESKWQDLLEYGRQKGRESGYTEADVPRVVKEWRQEQKRGR